ncbi:hypothetical protein SAMN06269185_1051 [Natronoarchaeum philippinense]|uniref:Uncharacterized protein n=1 Tax=Natronoarchaeum philippinense TaxID=558529 RepID=A0A285NDV5_NATPI|nr:hypothetical protein [Natronoarchaeum philippinense]SNZ06106.1 hypothetical protein SAMN06269185_1051 [Natronoarchaeum philippinense]
MKDNNDDVIEQREFEAEYEGLTTPCPFCDPDDEDGPGYQPRVNLSLGFCHECGAEFDVIVRWKDDAE